MRDPLYQIECRLASYFSRIGAFCMDWATWFFAFFLKKDLGKMLFPKAVKWVKENVRIVERAGLKFYVFDKKFPLYMRFALGRESEYSEMALWNTAFFKLFSTELNSARIWREGCDICACGKMNGPLDFRKIEGDLLHKYGVFVHVGYFNYKVRTADQAIELIVESLDKTDFAEEIHPYSFDPWFKKVWRKFYNWIHEIDYENSRKWMDEHVETMTVECHDREIKVAMLYDDCPEYVQRYFNFPTKPFDIFYMNDHNGLPAMLKMDNVDCLDFRKLPKEICFGLGVQKKNIVVLRDVVSPARLAKIIKDIE